MTGLAFKNAIRLHLDSTTLFKSKSYPSAYFLSILSLEELGKVFYLQDFLYHARVDCGGVVEEHPETDWRLSSIFSHKDKQRRFASEFGYDLPRSFLSKLESIESEKQNSVYVGLPKLKKRKIDYRARIINPLKLGKQKAHRQITTVSDILLELVLGKIKGKYIMDSDETEEFMDKPLYSRLRKKWEFTSPKHKRMLTYLEKHEDYDPNA